MLQPLPATPKTTRWKGTSWVTCLRGTLIASALLFMQEAAVSDPLAPGYQPLPFKAPEPGSYELNRMGHAADAALLDSAGNPVHLSELMQGKITLISFIYSSCHESNGCPLATHVLDQVRKELHAYPTLIDKVRILTISFDPLQDTPEVMARYGKSFVDQAVDWRFLTGSSQGEVDQLLRAYQQTVQLEPAHSGQKGRSFSHVLRILLIDSDGDIRNSYTPSVLHSNLVMADIRTLAESGKASAIPAHRNQGESSPRGRAGDDKDQYDQKSYQTNSASLNQRIGKAKDLIGSLHKNELGLPLDPEALQSPLSKLKVDLGRKLFYDRRLSLNGTFSCAMCHIPEQGFTSQEQSTAIGIEGRTIRRNAPTILNTGRLSVFFHDGRENRLDQQIWGPLLASNEMGNPSVGHVIDKIKSLKDYQGLFEAGYGEGPSMKSLGDALAQYERTLIAGASAFDRWKYAGEKNALNPLALNGYRLFIGKAGCIQCHSIGDRDSLFSDQAFHNTGIGFRGSMAPLQSKTKIQLAPGQWAEIDLSAIEAVSEKKLSDLGRYEITQNPSDRWKYRTPSLRNVALTAPYMHDGSLKSLEEVIRFYQGGGYPNPTLDPKMQKLSLTQNEMEALVEFLRSLTGQHIDQLVEDAWAVPVGDPKSP
jgi:cytochrome c peroxidase